MVQIKQKKDGAYTLRIEGLGSREIVFFINLLAPHESKLLKRINKFCKRDGELEFSEVPKVFDDIFYKLLDHYPCEEGKENE